MKLVVLKYGESVFGENFIFQGGSKTRLLPISFVCYLVQTDGHNILVDVGCDDKAGFDMSIFCKPVDALKQYGLSPEDITDVIITHAHHDHIQAIGYYQTAIIYIQKDEYETGKRYIPQNFKVHTFEDEQVVADDILVKKIGGHTRGSSIVTFQYEGKEHVLCGDECYVEECLKKKIPTGSTYSPSKSENFVMEYSKPQYRTFLFHDPNIMPGEIGYRTILLS